MTFSTKNIRRLGFILAGFLLLTFKVNAMAAIFGTNTLFSEVDGFVTLDGKPCISAKITQTIFKTNGKEISTNKLTDDNGYFRFEEISENKGLLSFLPSEFVVTQRLLISYDGTEHLGWAHTKRSAKQNSESSFKPFTLECDLSKKIEKDDKHTGICRLKVR